MAALGLHFDPFRHNFNLCSLGAQAAGTEVLVEFRKRVAVQSFLGSFFVLLDVVVHQAPELLIHSLCLLTWWSTKLLNSSSILSAVVSLLFVQTFNLVCQMSSVYSCYQGVEFVSFFVFWWLEYGWW
ncbi:hypothetical protein BgiMline_018820 [Biomphalaria glabrata]|nr:hypothetical protein BgiMline_006413 [Biomphalaria glabrata]